ncbi:hypothetical protein GUJ93_ZPchr0003g18584 [Zizania palustris]|uniref:DWNN domain-containing protein n=1 Tax=Zizania palustris TaxID=103762 RepID=A0A8J5RXD2_ZIZPA|nr:hypothetical protein GUJ93_ZPchr0003g18584 [Zizania palustris]
MGVVYYKYKSAKETLSVPVLHSFVSVSELKQLILTSDKHGRGRTFGRGPREDIVISNAQTGEEFTDESALIPQNSTVLIRRTAGQLSQNIVLYSSQKVIGDGTITSNKSVITESTSKSHSSPEVQDEDSAIASIIDAAELKWEEKTSKKGQTSGRFTSERYGHGPVERETPPGYVCRSCGVPGHFIQHCQQEKRTPPSGYICYRCRIPGHFIHHCPTIGDPKFDDYKKHQSLAPEVSCLVDSIPSALAPAASVSFVDDLPAELHCQLCNKVMADAVLTSKCCFDSFCDKCIRDYIIMQSKCICGVKVLADDLVPNQTLRSTISNMLATRTSSITCGTGKHRSSSGSNLDPNSAGQTPSAALEKQSRDHHVSSGIPDDGLKIATEDDHVSQHKLTTGVNIKIKDEGNSAGMSVEKAVPTADVRLKNGSKSISKVAAISGTLEPKAARTDQSKKRKKADSTKFSHPNNANYGYSIPFDPAYYNPYTSVYPWLTEPYMYGSLGMPYGGYQIGPYDVNSISNMPLALAMQGNLANDHSWETQSMLHRASGNASRSRLPVKPKETAIQSRSSDRSQHLGSSHGDPMNKSRSSSDRGAIGIPLNMLRITVPMITTRFTVARREHERLLQVTVTDTADQGPDTVLGVVLMRIQAMMNTISRGDGDAEDRSPWKARC